MLISPSIWDKVAVHIEFSFLSTLFIGKIYQSLAKTQGRRPCLKMNTMGLRLEIWLFFLALFQICLIVDGFRYLGSPALWRESEDSVKKALIIFDPTKRNPREGTVIGWNVYTTRGRRSQTAHLQVWRQVNPNDNIWRLVGQTIFVARWVGHNYFPLYPKDRIDIKTGDTIGVYFPKYNPIPWSSAACGHDNEHIFRYNPRNIKVGREFKFEKSSSDWKPCREYSVNATIVDPEELQSTDITQLKFANTRRYHGNFLPTLKPPVGGATSMEGHVTSFLLLSLSVWVLT